MAKLYSSNITVMRNYDSSNKVCYRAVLKCVVLLGIVVLGGVWCGNVSIQTK